MVIRSENTAGGPRLRVVLWGDSLTEGRPGIPYPELLERRLPEVVFVNRGRGGDTVSSLLNRVRSDPSRTGPEDLAVLWIGVNDLYPELLPGHRYWKSAAGQHPTRDAGRFVLRFRTLLDELIHRSRRILVLPPLFVGENPVTRINARVRDFGDRIADVAAEVPGCRFVDIRDSLPLSQDHPPHFSPTNPLIRFLDRLKIPGRTDIDGIANRRGLRWTYDGLHLNSLGAQSVSDRLYVEIMSELEAGN